MKIETINFEKYIGKEIQYETKSGLVIVTEIDKGKARFLNEHLDNIKEFAIIVG